MSRCQAQRRGEAHELANRKDYSHFNGHGYLVDYELGNMLNFGWLQRKTPRTCAAAGSGEVAEISCRAPAEVNLSRISQTISQKLDNDLDMVITYMNTYEDAWTRCHHTMVLDGMDFTQPYVPSLPHNPNQRYLDPTFAGYVGNFKERVTQDLIDWARTRNGALFPTLHVEYSPLEHPVQVTTQSVLTQMPRWAREQPPRTGPAPRRWHSSSRRKRQKGSTTRVSKPTRYSLARSLPSTPHQTRKAHSPPSRRSRPSSRYPEPSAIIIIYFEGMWRVKWLEHMARRHE